ncbi:MAG: PaaI family thioesterase [bacterium]|nr:PaaI family thioesterase [bacterium]MCP5067501.1 PaaI family thioesterase [bacterium]
MATLDDKILQRFDPEVARTFLKAPGGFLTGLPKYLGVDIVDVGPGTLRAEMTVKDELRTPFGNIHGGVLAAVCDHVLGCVCYPLMERGAWAATTEFKINLLAPVSSGVITADAKIVSMTRSTAVVVIEAVNEGRLVCVSQGTVTIRPPRKKNSPAPDGSSAPGNES